MKKGLHRMPDRPTARPGVAGMSNRRQETGNGQPETVPDMARCRLPVSCLLFVVLLFPQSARAGTVTEPFAGVSVEELYDSNVLNSRGQDVVTRITPRV